MHGACERGEPELRRRRACAGCSTRWSGWPCAARAGSSPGSTPSTSAAAPRRGSAAWRTPPAIQAYGRAGRPARRAALPRGRPRGARGVRDARRRLGVRTTGFAGGVHYLQYSFAPRLYIFNAFLQSLIGLHDFGRIADDDRATRAVRGGRAGGRARRSRSRTSGDWSRYSYRGAEATGDYHELLREFLAVDVHAPAGRALLRVRRPLPRLPGRPARADLHGPGADDRQAADRRSASRCRSCRPSRRRSTAAASSCSRELATFRRGVGAFAWRPRGPGLFTVRLGAKELRTGLGKKDKAATEIEVEPAQ